MRWAYRAPISFRRGFAMSSQVPVASQVREGFKVLAIDEIRALNPREQSLYFKILADELFHASGCHCGIPTTPESAIELPRDIDQMEDDLCAHMEADWAMEF